MNQETQEHIKEDISTKDFKGYMPGYIRQGVPPYL